LIREIRGREKHDANKTSNGFLMRLDPMQFWSRPKLEGIISIAWNSFCSIFSSFFYN
jgi:hypothetical protein